MKKALLLILLQAAFAGSQGQNMLVPDWIREKTSAVGGIAESWGVGTDTNGDVYWTASADSMGQGLDIFCYKFGPDGSPLWPAPLFYGGLGTQHAFACNAEGPALYIGGRYCPLSGFSCDMLLLKADKSTGVLLWAETLDFGNNGYDEVDGLAVRDDGVYCGGWAQALQTGPYQLDIGLWKLDADGNTQWTNHFGKTGTAEHQDGHFVVDEDFIYAAGVWGATGLANAYNGQCFLGKFSRTDGSFIDSTLFGNPSSNFLDAENALGMATDGDFLYITGYTTPVASNDWQVFVAKFSKDLHQIWFGEWGGSGTDNARGIAVSDGKVFVAGVTQSPEYAQGGASDALLLIYDTDGNFLSYHTWGDTLDNGFRDIAISGEDIYLPGTSGYQLFSGGGGDLGFLLKTNKSAVSGQVDLPEQEPLSIKVVPNPIHISADIRTNFDLEGYSLSVFDVFGREVFRSPELSGRQVEINASRYPGGLYFFTLSRPGNRAGGMFVIE
jgi:hypothetical protein